MRTFALELGVTKLGSYAGPSLHDALGLGDLCHTPRPAPAPKAHLGEAHRDAAWLSAPSVYHVSPDAGEVAVSEYSVGYGKSARHPMRLKDAIHTIRSRTPEQRKAQAATILLHGGTYYEAIKLGAQDGGGAEDAPVVWAAAPGEVPIISGGTDCVAVSPVPFRRAREREREKVVLRVLMANVRIEGAE